MGTPLSLFPNKSRHHLEIPFFARHMYKLILSFVFEKSHSFRCFRISSFSFQPPFRILLPFHALNFFLNGFPLDSFQFCSFQSFNSFYDWPAPVLTENYPLSFIVFIFNHVSLPQFSLTETIIIKFRQRWQTLVINDSSEIGW